MIAERDGRWSRAAQVGMLMRVYRETFPLGGGRRGLTQANLLQRMSEVNSQYAERYSHVTVSRWESGGTLPTVERLQDFGKALGLAPPEVEGLMSLAGFGEEDVAGPVYVSSEWTADDPAADTHAGSPNRLAPADEHVGSPADDRTGGHPIPGSAILDLGSVIRYLSYKCVLTGLGIAALGYLMAGFGWNNAWMPVAYVAAMMCLVAGQGLLHRRRPLDLGEFYSTTVFFLLSTFLLQSAFIRMDPYGFYTVGDYAGTHIPYLLALEVNLVLASAAGLAFHLLRQWQYSWDHMRSNALKRAVAVTLPPTLFAYACIVMISNISLWIQLVMVLPPMAGVFMVLLVLRDPTVRPDARDRRFALVTVVAWTAVMGALGAAVVAAMYLAPNTPSVLPDHNLWTSWQIDFGQLGYPPEAALERLNRGYLWHGSATFLYVVLVVGGALISSIYRIGRGDPAPADAPDPVSGKVGHVVAAWARRARSAVVPRTRSGEASPAEQSQQRPGMCGLHAATRFANPGDPKVGRLAVR